MYGDQCVPSLDSVGTLDKSSVGNEIISIGDITGGDTVHFTASPKGDELCRVMFGGQFHACKEGWLSCISELDGIVKDYAIPASS